MIVFVVDWLHPVDSAKGLLVRVQTRVKLFVVLPLFIAFEALDDFLWTSYTSPVLVWRKIEIVVVYKFQFPTQRLQSW